MIRSTRAKVAARLAAAGLGLLLTPAVLAIQTAPAAAAVPDRWGFAYMNVTIPPGPGTLIDVTRQWGAWKVFAPAAMATVDPIGLGRYRVHFPFTASINGVAHVTAVAPDARYCQLFNVYPSGSDQIVEVQCYRNGGVMDWSRFTVMYSTSSGPPVAAGTYAYVAANIGGGTLASFNSVGGGNLNTHLGIGQYRVTLPGVGSPGFLDGNVQVTASHPNSPRRCKVGNWVASGATVDVLVYCFDGITNALSDTWFDLSYQRKRAVFGGLAPPSNIAYLWLPGLGGPTDYNSAGAINTVLGSGVGQYMVTFPAVAIAETHVQVTAFNASRDYCNLQDVWQFNGPNVIVRNVICFNAAGVQAPNNFFVTYTSRV